MPLEPLRMAQDARTGNRTGLDITAALRPLREALVRLYKTTLIIWSDFAPNHLEIDKLARDAMSGESYCSHSNTELIDPAENDPHWDNTEFFGVDEAW